MVLKRVSDPWSGLDPTPEARAEYAEASRFRLAALMDFSGGDVVAVAVKHTGVYSYWRLFGVQDVKGVPQITSLVEDLFGSSFVDSIAFVDVYDSDETGWVLRTPVGAEAMNVMGRWIRTGLGNIGPTSIRVRMM